MWTRIGILTFSLLLVLTTLTQTAAASVISLFENAPPPVRHAAGRLSDYTGIPIDRTKDREHSIRVDLGSAQNLKIGAQGYTIRTSEEGDISIRANTAEGVANGVYTFLRTLMIEHRKDPFSRPWEVEEKPQFPIRTMLVSPYRFGASVWVCGTQP